jgi:hypothetical protein
MSKYIVSLKYPRKLFVLDLEAMDCSTFSVPCPSTSIWTIVGEYYLFLTWRNKAILFDLKHGRVTDHLPDIPGIFGSMIVVALDSVVYLIGCGSKAYTISLEEKNWVTHTSSIDRGYGKRYTLIGRRVALFMNTNYDLSNRSYVITSTQTINLLSLDTFTVTSIEVALPILGPFCPIPISSDEIVVIGGFESYSADGMVLTLKNLNVWRVNVATAQGEIVGEFSGSFEETYIPTPGTCFQDKAYCISNRQIAEVNLQSFSTKLSYLDRTALQSVLQFAWVYQKAVGEAAKNPRGLEKLHRSVFRYSTHYLKFS